MLFWRLCLTIVSIKVVFFLRIGVNPNFVDQVCRPTNSLEFRCILVACWTPNSRQLRLSMERHMRVSIKAPSWGSVNLTQYTHDPPKLGCYSWEGRGGSWVTMQGLYQKLLRRQQGLHSIDCKPRLFTHQSTLALQKTSLTKHVYSSNLTIISIAPNYGI